MNLKKTKQQMAAWFKNFIQNILIFFCELGGVIADMYKSGDVVVYLSTIVILISLTYLLIALFD